MRLLGVAACLMAAGLAVGCAGAPAPAPRVPEPALVLPPDPPVAPTGLVVRLLWAGPADLDLLVTDPEGHTYSVENGGAVFVGDVRCEDVAATGSAVETAEWAAPAPGRYRVGVDYPVPCRDDVAVPYRVLVDLGGRRRTVDGSAGPLQRIPNAAEFVVP